MSHFDELEPHKENILPSATGHSTSRLLKSSLNHNMSEISEIRLSFEKRIMDDLEEIDDPLQLYLEYIYWLNDAYPQGVTTKQSDMLNVMERCLLYFQNVETYKNDPRYLKIWLWYIDGFAQKSSEKKDLFIFLMRNQIGEKLALFYEEFANLFFARKEFGHSIEILNRGLGFNARPINRLKKSLKLLEDEIRKEGVTLQDLSISETAFELHNETILGKNRSQISQFQGPLTAPLANHGKIGIFKDDDICDTNSLGLVKSTWSDVGKKKYREKENIQQVIPLIAGTKLKPINQSYIPEKDIDKLSIFKDALGMSGPVYKILEISGRKPEKIDCNFNLIYPTQTEEFCFEEILAISRNIYYKKLKFKSLKNTHSTDQIGAENTLKSTKRPKIGLQEKLIDKLLISQASDPPTTPTNSQEYRKVTTTTILPLNDNEHDDHPLDLEKRQKSPTITMFSKDAMNEVYSMFNQNYIEPRLISEHDDTTSKFAIYENFTQEFTENNLDDLTEVKHIPVQALQKTPHKDERKENNAYEHTTPLYKSKLHSYMTPIQERSESAFKMMNNQDKDGKIEREKSDTGTVNTAESSPFLTQPHLRELDNNVIIDPLDENRKLQLLQSLQPPLNTYESFYQYTQPLKMSSLLKKIHKASKNVNKNPIVEFKKTNDLYCIRTELGQGGYATVYLAESSTGMLKALKVEKPASSWEFYILKQIEKRLKQETILRSIITVSALHIFQDESYLVLNYANQGTVLDLVNLERARSGSLIDESLCMFISIEIMKVLECIHDVGIIHGDVKPDNCMIRFEEYASLGNYNSNGENGWDHKGIYLIDFGRSFDLTLFPLSTKFKANWKTDQQDCPEMREGKPWSYEADYYGLAGIIHVMLFGKYIEIMELPDGTYKLGNSLKRYWNKDIWLSLFATLLNSNKLGKELPITQDLRLHREKMQAYLEQEANTKLRNLVIEMESELSKLKK